MDGWMERKNSKILIRCIRFCLFCSVFSALFVHHVIKLSHPHVSLSLFTNYPILVPILSVKSETDSQTLEKKTKPTQYTLIRTPENFECESGAIYAMNLDAWL